MKCCLFVLMPAMAASALVGSVGKRLITNETITEAIDHTGNLTLQHCTVLEPIEVVGTLKVVDSTLRNGVDVTGNMTSTGSKFENTLILKGHEPKLTLTDSTTKNIRVISEASGSGTTFTKKRILVTSSSWWPFDEGNTETTVASIPLDVPHVSLAGKTTVDGSIEFVGKEGIVQRDQSATITGKVINSKELP